MCCHNSDTHCQGVGEGVPGGRVSVAALRQGADRPVEEHLAVRVWGGNVLEEHPRRPSTVLGVRCDSTKGCAWIFTA